MPPPHGTSEELLRHLVQPICLVGNATSQYRLGVRIDSYPTVIRMNNYRIAGFEPQVGSRTTLRAVTGWSDVENRGEHTEFSPFTASARESAHLEAYNSRNHIPVLTAALDVHPLIPELGNPSLGFALVQLLHSLAIPVDLFNFDGLRSAHYGDPISGLHTTRLQGELDLILVRGNAVLFDETFDYAPLYDFCHAEHPEYNDNVGLHLARQHALAPSGERILEFGAGNGALAHHLESLGNAVTAIEVSGRACAGISCNQVIQGSALSLVTLEGKYDRFVSIDVLEHLTENDARIVVREAARLARRIFVTVSTRPSALRGPQGEDLHLCLRPPEWWEALFAGEFDMQIRHGPHDRQYILEGVSRRAPQSHPVIATRATQSDRYFIKEGYQCRDEAQHFEDHVSAETGIIWQPDVYAFVGALAQATGSAGVVDMGCGRAEKLLGLRGTVQTLGIDIGSNIAYCKRTFPEEMWLEWDLERDELPPVPQAFLHESLLVCSDVIEHLRNPRPLLRHLYALLGEAAFAVVTTPERDLRRSPTDYGPPANPAHVREWNRDELVQLLVSEGLTIDLVGTTSSNSQENANATTIVVLGNSRLDASERLKRLGQAALGIRETTQQALTGSLRRLLLSVSSRRLLGEDLLTLLRRVPTAPAVEATVGEHLKVAYGEIQDLARRGDLHRASAMLRGFLDRHPECALGHNDLGVLSYALGETLTAKACYERAIDLDPAVLSFRKNLADLKFAAFREVGESLALYGAVLASAPTDVEALQNTALIFNAIGKTDEACAIAHRLRVLDEHNAVAQALCPGLPFEILEPLPREMNSRGRGSRAPGYSFCIITNGKRPQKLLSELESIRSQKLADYEILLGGDIPEWLDTTGIRVLPMREAARAGRLGEIRNFLCREVRYATLIVADDDMIFHEGFIEAVEHFEGGFDALAVRIINPDGTRFWDWASVGGVMRHRLLAYGQHDPRVYVTGGLIVLRAEVTEHVAWDGTRGFYQDKDVDFSDRLREAGFSIQFCAGAVATHDDPSYTQKGNVVVRTHEKEDEVLEDRPSTPVLWAAPFLNPSGYASEAISSVVPLAEAPAQVQVREHFTSVVVLGEAPERAGMLDSLQDLSAEDHEIIRVSNEPVGGARIRVGTFAEAVARARGDGIVVMRSGVQPGEGWIAGLRRALFGRPGYSLASPLEEWLARPLEQDELLARARTLAHKRTFRRVRPVEVGEACLMVTREIAAAATRESGTSTTEIMRGLWIQALARGRRCVLAADTLVACTGPQPRSLAIRQLLAQRMQETPDERLTLQWGNFRVQQALQRGDIEGALDVQRALLGRFPNEGVLVRQMIWLLLRAGRAKEATKMLQGRSDEDRDDAEWLKLEGYCALAQGELDRADRCSGRILENQPLSCRALLLRGMVASSRGEAPAAERSFRAAQVADPSRGLPHMHLGSLLWARGDHQQALEELERGFVLSPDDPEVAATYSDAASQLDAEERASELVVEAVRLYPDVRHLLQLKASFLLAAGKPQAARATLLEMMARFGVEDGLLNAAIELSKDAVQEEPSQTQGAPQISLCMIVKDEQEHLSRALWSSLPVADEIIVVDTGSSDRSVEVAMAFGCRVIRHAWNDSFASARNAGIAAARGSWVLVLDADEELPVAEYQTLRELVGSPGRQRAYRMLMRNYVAAFDVTGFRRNDGTYREEVGAGWVPSLKVRLFPRDPSVRFEGAVHETVEPSLGRAGLRIEDAPVVIHHYGKVDRHRMHRKGQLYRTLGQEKLLSESASLEAKRELAVEEEYLGNFVDALSHWRRCLVQEPEDLQALLGIGRSAIGSGETAAALEALERARDLDGLRPEPRLQLVIAMLHAGRGGEALANARALDRDHPRLDHAQAVLVLALLAEGTHEEALAKIRVLQDQNVSLEEFLTGHARRFLRFGPWKLAVALLQPLADAGIITAEQAAILVDAYHAQTTLA